MSKSKQLQDLERKAAERVAIVERLDAGAAFAEPVAAAREAVAQLREESRGPLFPDAVTPIPAGVPEAWAAYSEGTEDYAPTYAARCAALHAAALHSFPSLAEFARGPIIRARVRRAGANTAAPASEMVTPGEPVRQIETPGQAAARGADEAEQMFMEACARAILAAQAAPAVADLVPVAQAFVTSCDLARRLDATLSPRETHAKAEAARIERAAHEAEEAILVARRSSLVTFFEGLATTVFPEIQSIGGIPVGDSTVTGDHVARALAAGYFGAAGLADELERAEKVRDNYRARVRHEADRVEQLAAVGARK